MTNRMSSNKPAIWWLQEPSIQILKSAVCLEVGVQKTRPLCTLLVLVVSTGVREGICTGEAFNILQPYCLLAHLQCQ